MGTQLTKIGSTVIGRDTEGYDMIQVPFSHLPVSVAHYYEAPNCDLFFDQDETFPVRFDLDVVGVQLAFEPVVAWNDLGVEMAGAEMELAQARNDQNQARATAMTRALLPGWVPPEAPRTAAGQGFWAGVREVHSGAYYLDGTEYPNDQEAGLAATKIADRLIRQAAKKYLEQGAPRLVGAGLQAPSAGSAAYGNAAIRPASFAGANPTVHAKV